MGFKDVIVEKNELEVIALREHFTTPERGEMYVSSAVWLEIEKDGVKLPLVKGDTIWRSKKHSARAAFKVFSPKENSHFVVLVLPGKRTGKDMSGIFGNGDTGRKSPDKTSVFEREVDKLFLVSEAEAGKMAGTHQKG